VTVVKERDVGEDKAVTALLEHDLLRLRDGDIHRRTDRVSALGGFGGGNVSGRKCQRETSSTPMRSVTTIWPESMRGKPQRHGVLSRSDLDPFVRYRSANVTHANLEWNESRRVGEESSGLDAEWVCAGGTA
jgi:hypothetical protein